MRRAAAFHRLLDVVGLKTFTLLDIGARGGIHERWKPLGDRLRVLAFEPDEASADLLKRDARLTPFPVALGNVSGTVPLHVLRQGGSSSIYPPNRSFLRRFPEADRFDEVAVERVPVERLDRCLEGRGVESVAFVKMDVHGAESAIVEGGRPWIAQACGLEVEVCFAELYQGQAPFHELDRMFRGLGFFLMDLRPAYWKRSARPSRGIGQIVFGDALYLRDPVAEGAMPRDPAGLMIAAVLYQKFDFAAELATHCHGRGRYTSGEHEEIRRLLEALSNPRVRFPRVRGESRLADLLARAADALKERFWARYDDWK